MDIQSPRSSTYVGEDSTLYGGYVSGVSWGAILAGATGAAALSLILLMLGVGLGLSSVSPWSYNSSNGNALGIATIAWLAFMQLAASGVGGYLAGRLRVRWAGVHSDEVFFRDTAHGMLAWAVASLVTVSLLSSGVSAILSDAADAGAGAAKTAVSAAATAASGSGKTAGNAEGTAAGANDSIEYFSARLLRTDQPQAEADSTELRGEVGKIFMTGIQGGNLEPADRDYLTTLIAKRTGLAPSEAQQRVDDVYARIVKARNDAITAAKEAADKARKVAAHSALWMFVTLLLGAFVASLSATFGGTLRDRADVAR